MKRIVSLVVVIVVVSTIFIIIHYPWDESIVRSDIPISSEMATSELKMNLPKYIKNVYFVSSLEGFQIFNFFLRYDVDSQKLNESVCEMINWDNKGWQEKRNYEKRDLTPSEYIGVPNHLKPMNWWRLNSIKEGYELHPEGFFGLRIWVDVINSRVYIYQSS